MTATSWLNRDPIGELGGLNLYGYAGNNPICFVDPFGLVWYNPASWAPIVAAGNAVGDAISGTIDVGELVLDPQLNYDRNNYNFVPPSEGMVVNNPSWRTVPEDKSVAHQQGTCPSQGNNKYVSPNGHYEAVYDANGNAVTSGPNIGTYNFYDYNSDPVKHALYDILPWIVSGASANDPSTIGQRISAISGPQNGH